MKKSLIALAVLAASGAAFAQSTVTLYGVVDAGYINETIKGINATNFAGGGVNGTSRLGFRGTEDLGGGLKAVFQVETGLNSGKEAATSIGNRGAFVGLTGGFGTVALGSSVLSPSFFARSSTDASTANNYSIATYGGDTRLDNSVNYTSPNFSGLTIRASMVQRADNGTKAATDMSAVFNNGPLTVAASVADNGKAEGKGSYIGAAYNLGMATVFVNSVKAVGTPAVAAVTFIAAGQGVAGRASVDAVAAKAGDTFTGFGVSAPVGAFTLQGDYNKARNSGVNTYVLSAQYALSKRSSVTGFTSKASDAASRVGFGIRHNF